MKSVSDILHKTPWWALIFGGLATFVALAVFVTPYHIIQYRDEGRSADESRAIKREVDNTFAENAINIGRGVIKGILARTSDPERRAELEEALAGLEEARVELREAGTEALRAKRESLQAARQATRNLREAVRKAQRETERALKSAGPEAEAARRALEKSLEAAEQAEREAEKSVRRSEKGSSIQIGPSKGDGRPMIQIEIDPTAEAPPPVAPPTPGEATPPPVPGVPSGAVPTPPAPGAVPTPPTPGASPPLPPEVARKIRRDVTGDMYRVGIGAALLLVLVPIFVLAIVAKFFLDRSRASQKLAEAKRREAEYHRMGQQVTEAKLAALQAQVEPHFLYNTLASVQALTEVDPAKAHEMTGHLIQYLRNALPKMRESVSTVGQEVELVRAYLSILQMRMGPRLTFAIAVPESLAALPFPPLMLPSLVENAIKHGLEPQREGGSVHIGADLADDKLRLVVSDTGRGFAEAVGAGVGLANIRERLAALYGDAARLTLEANTPHGVIATIEVPADGARAGANAAGGAAAASARAEAPPAAARPAPAPDAVPPKTGFWPRTWEVLGVMERVWRMTLYYLYLGLLAVAGIVAIGAVVGMAIGAIPVTMDNDLLIGPGGAFVGLAVVIIAFVVVAAALAIVMTVLYAVGFLVFGVALFVAVVLLVSLSPLLAPVALVGLFIWWIARRGQRPAAPRVEPTLQPAAAPSAQSADAGR